MFLLLVIGAANEDAFANDVSGLFEVLIGVLVMGLLAATHWLEIGAHAGGK